MTIIPSLITIIPLAIIIIHLTIKIIQHGEGGLQLPDIVGGSTRKAKVEYES
jgi:hypothetical protein